MKGNQILQINSTKVNPCDFWSGIDSKKSISCEYSMEYMKMMGLSEYVILAVCFKSTELLCQKLLTVSVLPTFPSTNLLEEVNTLLILLNPIKTPEIKYELKGNNNIRFYN